MNIKEVLDVGIEKLNNRKIEDASLKAKILLGEFLNVSKEYLMIHEEEKVDEEIEREYFYDIDRLMQNEPIQYIIGYQEFMGLYFYVNRNVLIPRQDTETLVEEVISISRNLNKKIEILDLCTGSGAIGVSLAKHLDNVEVSVSDISNKALLIAKDNASINGVKVNLIESDIFKQIDIEKKFDIIVSNPPYIETDTINSLPEEVKKEPIIALDGGTDGLFFYREIAQKAKDYLISNGILALEIGYTQKEPVEKILEEEGYVNIYSKKDLAGNDRIVVCGRG